MKELYKTLVLAWSVVWGACIVGLFIFNAYIPRLGGLLILTALDEKIAILQLLYLAPLYAFSLWIAGCIGLAMLCWILKRWVK